MRSFRIVLAVTGLIVVVFNDTFGKLEGFVEFLFLYFILVCIAVLQWLFVNIKQIINLKNEKTKTELLHLQSQINPHFFFNMLNNLYGLVDKDGEKAKNLILKMSDMMRYSIYEGQKALVSLQQEIDFIDNFIALHQMRYHKKVDLDFAVDAKDTQVKVIPLLFIILVENAFKHGVEVLRQDAFVQISLKATHDQIVFVVNNNFDNEQHHEKGIGLKNLKRRLALAYPKKHEIQHTISNNHYTARLSLDI